MRRILTLGLLATISAAVAGEPAAPSDLEVLAKALTTPLKLLRGGMPAFTVTIDLTLKDKDAGEQTARLTLVRADAARFALSVSAGELAADLVRDADQTRLVVPPRQVAFVGKGTAPADSPLAIEAVVASLSATEPKVQLYLGMIRAGDPAALAFVLQQFGQLKRVQAAKAGDPATFAVSSESVDGRLTVEVTPDGTSLGRIAWSGPGKEGAVTLRITDEARLPAAATDGLKVVPVARPELERALGLGLARGLDLLFYATRQPKPDDEERAADGARLRVKDGRRLAILGGTPREIGLRHGKLLAPEMRRFYETQLYAVGTWYSVQRREWFLDTLRGAFAQLKPHVPADYLDEMAGLAEGSGIPLETVQLANVLPAFWRASGFVILPKATETKQLYHGAMLDFPTEAGLQRDAAVFVVRKTGAIPFVTIGYAGLLGGVAGLNARQVCVSAMGGIEGPWDGTPMPVLTRMVLERAATLKDAERILQTARRTREYYYLISDSKAPAAVGVKATQKSIELLEPGKSHPQFPRPVDNCLMIAGGKAYDVLAVAVKARAGDFSSFSARKLMRPPMIRESNPCDILFLPLKYDAFVSHARGASPAYKEDYERYGFTSLLLPPQPPKPAAKD